MTTKMAAGGVFGVFFGYSSSCIAACRDGKADVIANDLGDRVTPTVVSYTECEKTVGASAKQSLNSNAANTVRGVKWLIGKTVDDEDVLRIKDSQSVKIVERNGSPVYSVSYKEKPHQFTPVDVACTIYEKLHETATSQGGNIEGHDAVITVPLYFNQQQREAMRSAATSAKFNVLRVINEPTAAVLAYNIGQENPSEAVNVLVYHHGGETLDVTVIQSVGGMYRVCASCHRRDIGGHVIDSLIVDNFASEFQRLTKMDCRGNKRSMNKLTAAAENCKRILSTLNVTQCSVESLYDGIDFNNSLSRSRLEGLCAGFVQKCLEPFSDVLTKASLTSASIHKVIMCGGTAKIPQIQQNLRDYFPKADVLTSIPPDEVIAVGAAMQAAMLSETDTSYIEQCLVGQQISCMAVDILLQVYGNDEKHMKVIDCGTAIPVRRQRKFELDRTESSMCVHVLQRLPHKHSSLSSLAKINMVELTGGCSVTVTLHVRHDGSLHIACTESGSGKVKDVVVEVDGL